MKFTKYIEEILEKRKNKKRILFMDGSDDRAQEAALAHKKANKIIPVLLIETNDVAKDIDIEKIVISDWKSKEEILINKYLEIRKGKDNIESAKKVIFDPATFCMLMVAMNKVDGAIGGLSCPSSDVLRAAFKVIGPKKGVKTISSVMVMEKGEEWYIFTDVSVNISPNVNQLVEIAQNASTFANLINFETKIAFLSFSTSGSAVHEKSTIIKEATNIFNNTFKPKYKAIGEVQFDAAFSENVRKIKYKGEAFDGKPTIFIFPTLDVGNIGYKIAQRMGGFGAIGPIITGINKPINDLSRGAKVDDVYNTALLTAVQVVDN